MENKGKRILMSTLGVIICGISVGFFKRSSFGVDPFQTFMGGMDAIIPISFGTLYVIVNICLLMFSLIFDRKKIGLATLVNLFLLGYVVDFSYQTLLNLFPEVNMAGRIAMIIFAIVIMCLSSAFYFTADMGVSTYDAVALIISGKWKLIRFKYCRIITDLVCVITGVVLFLAAGRPAAELVSIVGIGTIITAFFMGPLIDYFNVHVAQPFLYGKKAE